MKKIYIYVIAIIILIILLQYSFLPLKGPSSKYDTIKYNSKNSIVQTISSYVVIPIIESRIDFYLKATGIITHLESYKYDNRLLEIKDIKDGSGTKILCGQEVIIDLNDTHLKTQNGKLLKIGMDEIQAVNIGLIGMKEGGTRTIIVPSKISERLTGIKDTKTIYTITLKKVISHYPSSVKNLLVFDNIIGNERAIMCGDLVSLKYKTRDVKGNVVQNGKLSFKVGEGKVPLGFELGVIEMVPGGKRTIISPPDLLDENFPRNHVSIIDLSIE